MKCPFCDLELVHTQDGNQLHHPPADGPLVTKESGSCLYQNDTYPDYGWTLIGVALIDADGD